MILTRLANAIRHQNWSQIITEILIVVIGIFLGLQVTEWNEGRVERLEERDYLERLVMELKETIQLNVAVINELETSHKKLTPAINILNDGMLNRDTMPGFEDNFYSTAYVPHPALQSSAISEMIATGKVALISSAEIKNEIIRYNNAIITEQNNINGQFAEFLSVRNDINENIRLAPDYWLSKKILDDPEVIMSNKALIGKISFINEFQTRQLEQIVEFQVHTKSLEALLSDHLKINP